MRRMAFCQHALKFGIRHTRVGKDVDEEDRPLYTTTAVKEIAVF